MYFRQIKDPSLAQYAYLVGCQRTGEAIIFDPLRDVDRYLELARAEGLRIVAAAETHIHADFLAGTRELAHHHGVRPYLSDEGPSDWKYEWAEVSSYKTTFLNDKDVFKVGGIEFAVTHSPGHTPEHLIFTVTDRGGGSERPMGVISGDFVFVGDVGRPDLLETAAGTAGAMEPSARALYRSIVDFLKTPDYLQVWPGHGSGSACGKALGAVPTSTVGYERFANQSIVAAIGGEDEFVDFILDAQPEPPLYFGRMKQWNKQGPPVLGALPSPIKVDPENLLCGNKVILDTRDDRDSFMASHLPGALYAPLSKGLLAVAGSYVVPEQEIFLIVEEELVETAVRILVRIGLDKVVGYVTPSELEELEAHLISTKTVRFSEAEVEFGRPGTTVLDVRGASEFAARSIPNAINIAHTRLLDRLEEVPASDRLFVHCRSGLRAAYAVPLLERSGHEVIYIDDSFSNFGAAE